MVVPIPTPTGIVWNPQSFDEFDVYSPGVRNSRGDLISYRLIPTPNGGLAHHEEAFTQKDLWAVSGDPSDLDATQLPNYAQQRISLQNTQIALWYKGTYHHQPRDEDGYNSGSQWIGVTETNWAGFTLMPRNLFAQSPFFP